MNEFLKGKIKIDDFIKHHNKNFINYCEVIVHPDGYIEYACPSHNSKLIEIYKNIENVNNDLIASLKSYSLWYDIDELCNMTNCISVWYDHIIYPQKITKCQYHSLIKLKLNKCIYPDLKILNKK